MNDAARGIDPCYHCGESVDTVSRRSIGFDGVTRSLCCPGCEAVMQSIVDAGLGDYYRHRTDYAALGVVPADLGAALDSLSVYDEPEFAERYITAIDAEGLPGGDAPITSEVTLSVEGMRCGACVWLLERSLNALPGVERATFNFSTARARIRFDAASVTLSALLGRIASVGYRAMPFDARTRELGLEHESRQMLQRLFVAGIAMMQVMMYALPAYLTGADGVEMEHERILRWASLVLTTPVMLYSAQPFLAGAWRDVRNLRPGMDVPVSIGLIAAFSASVHATLTMRGEIWFDSVSMFVFLLLGARWLEWRARRRALRAVDDLGTAAPDTARLSSAGGDESCVPAARLVPGDRIRVTSGERLPADARVLGGHGLVDLSLLTGESVPVTVQDGQHVPGGALVAGTPLDFIVERGVSASALSMIDRLIERGASEKPRIVSIADRVASLFVTALLALAAIVFLAWWHIDPARAASVAIATLVVSCPCALSLATPAALAAATGRLLGSRLVVTRGHAIETLARVTDVVFDKTGTLTEARPVLCALTLADGISEATALDLAAALEAGSAHPFAEAIRRAARERIAGDRAGGDTCDLGLHDVHHAPGHGVAATDRDGSRLALGSTGWSGIDATTLRNWRARAEGAAATSEVLLTRRRPGGGIEALARFGFEDPVRSEAHATLAALQQRGLRVHLLSGDRSGVVDAVADRLGIASRHGDATPSDKQATVAALQRAGGTVLMVGDGINDAPVLALADVSLAVGKATALARTAADTISLASGIDAVETLLHQSRRAMRVVRQNLAWAASYNLLAVPAAAFGLVPPWAAALGMAASSLLVAGNALRLSL